MATEQTVQQHGVAISGLQQVQQEPTQVSGQATTVSATAGATGGVMQVTLLLIWHWPEAVQV